MHVFLLLKAAQTSCIMMVLSDYCTYCDIDTETIYCVTLAALASLGVVTVKVSWCVVEIKMKAEFKDGCRISNGGRRKEGRMVSIQVVLIHC